MAATCAHPRVLFVLLWRASPYPGTKSWGGPVPGDLGDPNVKPLSHGLSNSATFIVDMLNETGMAKAKLVHVGSDNDIWKEILAFGATDVVIEAFWMRPKKLDDLADRFPNVRFVVRGHSSTPFLAQDSTGFPWLLDYIRKPNGLVAPNDRRHLREVRFLAGAMMPDWTLEEVEAKIPFLPNYYPLKFDPPKRTRWHDTVNIGCFGAARPMKNMVGQAIAALMFGDWIRRPIRFHINGDRIESGGGPTVRALEAIFAALPEGAGELVRHDWMPHARFRHLIGTMDMVTQVSFAETFCIVAADAIAEGVPLVCSAEIPWAPRIIQADPTDTASIAHKLHEIWRMREIGVSTVPEVAHSLRLWNRMAREAWLEYFCQL